MDVLARRGALTLAAGLALASCYQPALRDCLVSCEAPGDCSSGQVCGADKLCAAPDVAGRCALLPPDAGADGAMGQDAAPPRDAGVDAPDAMSLVRLTVQIEGKGSVVLDGIASCSSLPPQRGRCVYDVSAGVAIRAQATAIQPDEVFARWTSMTCAGQTARCTFTPTAPTTISARFDKAN